MAEQRDDATDLAAFDRRRVALCLSGLDARPAADFGTGAGSGTVICGALESRRHIFRRYRDHYSWEAFRGARHKNYIREAQMLVREVDRDAVFSVYPGDSRSRFAVPTFVKSRLVADRDGGVVLLPLDRARHWRDVARIAASDIPYAAKSDRLVWRGGTTGRFRRDGGGEPLSSRAFVAGLSQAMPGIDVAYSEIVQVGPDSSDLPLAALAARLRPPLSLAEQLGAKMLLSLEGNDVATGLKWMLASNSVVVMPPPVCESWACEGDLRPFEHYVPVRPDLSDLAAARDWCLSHPADSAAIARQGRAFIQNFLDPGRERAVVRAVVAGYLEKARFRLAFGPLERLAQRLEGLIPGPAAGHVSGGKRPSPRR
jgi:hypothetical protein